MNRCLPGLSLCLSLAVPLGCGTGGLKEVEAPAEGVQLRYKLEPRSVADGHVVYRKSGGFGNETVEFDLTSLVKSVSDDGQAQVTTRIKNVRVVWNMGGMSDVVDESEVVASCQQSLEGSDIRFQMDATGKVANFPSAADAAGLPEVTRRCVDLALKGLREALPPLPEDTLAKGAAVEDNRTKGRKGRLGRYVETRGQRQLKGIFASKSDDAGTVAIVEGNTKVTTTTTTKSGGNVVNERLTSTLHFGLEEGFPRRIQSASTEVDGSTTSTTRLEVRWAKRPVTAAEPASSAPVTRSYDDPCDPNYVGAEICPDKASAYDDDAFDDVDPVAPPSTNAPSEASTSTDDSPAAEAPEREPEAAAAPE